MKLKKLYYEKFYICKNAASTIFCGMGYTNNN